MHAPSPRPASRVIAQARFITLLCDCFLNIAPLYLFNHLLALIQLPYEIKVHLKSFQDSIEMPYNVNQGSSSVNSPGTHPYAKTMNCQVCNNRNTAAQTGF